MLGRLQVPVTVKKGEVFEVRVLVQHPMETGFRRDMNGATIPVNVVDKLACRIAGREVFSAELGTGINSAAPALIGAPGTYFCSDPDTRAAERPCTRISWPCVYFFPSTQSVGGAVVSRRSISTCCTNPPASPSGSSPQSCICEPR